MTEKCPPMKVLLFGEEALAEELFDLFDHVVALFDEVILAFDVVDVGDGDGDGGDHGEAEALVFDLVKDSGGLGRAVLGEEQQTAHRRRQIYEQTDRSDRGQA